MGMASDLQDERDADAADHFLRRLAFYRENPLVLVYQREATAIYHARNSTMIACGYYTPEDDAATRTQKWQAAQEAAKAKAAELSAGADGSPGDAPSTASER